MRNYKREFLIGFLLGLFIPFVFFVISAFLIFNMHVVDFFNHLLFGDIFTHYLSLMVLFNGLFFFLLIKKKEYVSRGILFSTFLYAFVVLIIKILS